MHSPYLRKTADGSRHASAVKQKLCWLLCYVATCTHAPAAYSGVVANTTAIPCAMSTHSPTILPGYLS